MPDPRDKAAGGDAGRDVRPSATSGQEGREIDERVAPLLASAISGDEGAWRGIIELYGRRVYALAFSRCRRADLAEEVTQSVFATVAAKLGDGYAEQGRFESWLFRVAMNRVRDELRRLKRHADVVDPVTFRGMGGPEAEEGPEEGMLEHLREALGGLPDADREIIELRHHGQMSFKQMADLLEEPIGTLLARHHRALRKLKQLMQDKASRDAEQPAADERE